MVQTLWAAAVELVEALHQSRQRFHGGAELDGRTRSVDEVQRPPLVPHLAPLVWDGGPIAIFFGAIKIAVGQDAKADGTTDRRVRRLAQHQTVVAGLLQPAQVGGVLVAAREHKPENVAIRSTTGVKVPARQNDVANPSYIKRWI